MREHTPLEYTVKEVGVRAPYFGEVESEYLHSGSEKEVEGSTLCTRYATLVGHPLRLYLI
jgi:hypothetical protein